MEPVKDDALLAEDALHYLGLLADEERLRVLSAVALGATSLTDVATAAGMDRRSAGRALGRLAAGGLVEKGPDGYALSLEDLKSVVRAASERQRREDLDAPGEDAGILRAFFKGQRLVSVPTARSKRLVVLDYLAQSFEPGRHYPEREVNEILTRFHDDYATLRRHLVDEEFLTRERGEYWRSGGRVDVGE